MIDASKRSEARISRVVWATLVASLILMMVGREGADELRYFLAAVVVALCLTGIVMLILSVQKG